MALMTYFLGSLLMANNLGFCTYNMSTRPFTVQCAAPPPPPSADFESCGSKIFKNSSHFLLPVPALPFEAHQDFGSPCFPLCLTQQLPPARGLFNREALNQPIMQAGYLWVLKATILEYYAILWGLDHGSSGTNPLWIQKSHSRQYPGKAFLLVEVHQAYSSEASLQTLWESFNCEKFLPLYSKGELKDQGKVLVNKVQFVKPA